MTSDFINGELAVLDALLNLLQEDKPLTYIEGWAEGRIEVLNKVIYLTRKGEAE